MNIRNHTVDLIVFKGPKTQKSRVTSKTSKHKYLQLSTVFNWTTFPGWSYKPDGSMETYFTFQFSSLADGTSLPVRRGFLVPGVRNRQTSDSSVICCTRLPERTRQCFLASCRRVCAVNVFRVQFIYFFLCSFLFNRYFLDKSSLEEKRSALLDRIKKTFEFLYLYFLLCDWNTAKQTVSRFWWT